MALLCDTPVSIQMLYRSTHIVKYYYIISNTCYTYILYLSTVVTDWSKAKDRQTDRSKLRFYLSTYLHRPPTKFIWYAAVGSRSVFPLT